MKQSSDPPLSDAELVSKILETGDPSWFEGLYDRYADKVYHRCLSLLGSSDEARDASHDIFIKVYLQLSKYNHQAAFGTWLYAICYNFCIDSLRKKKRFRLSEIDDRVLEDTLAESDHDDLMQIKVQELRRVLSQLKPEDRSLLLMKYQDDLPVVQIGELLQLGESAVKMRLKRARQRALELYRKRIDPIFEAQ